jgi:signal transduction histidine kinase
VASAAGGFFGAAGLVVVGVVLTGLAVFFYRESSRELREARSRVRFVNQVSHELRTPLTNIRLYAELLEGRIGDGDVEARRKLEVIVAESERLSRLIGNVLTFARQGRGELALHPRPGSLDEVVGDVVEQFRPALAARGVTVEQALDAKGAVLLDRDAVEQIVGNLLSNVEKYAPRSGPLEIRSHREAGRTLLQVADRGPGIPQVSTEAVFRPFVRLSNRLTEGVSGTGIGLAIARDLARLQGGELRLVPSERGACFELELPNAPNDGEGEMP